MPEHNPDHLTPEQIGTSEGWRLLNEDEYIYKPPTAGSLERMEKGRWVSGNFIGSDTGWTYRTKLSPAELRKARGLEEESLELPPEKVGYIHSKDWPQDYTHENGFYMNACCLCGATFMGHKRRVVCGLCDKIETSAKELSDLRATIAQQASEKANLEIQAGVMREALERHSKWVESHDCMCCVANEAGNVDRCARCWDLDDIENALSLTPLPEQWVRREEAYCDVCGGSGTPASERKCICNGTGKAQVAAQTLREMLYDASVKAEAGAIRLPSDRSAMRAFIEQARKDVFAALK